MEWREHAYQAGSHSEAFDKLPEADELDGFIAKARKNIEPWLSAVFQSEHLNLLVGSGLTSAVGAIAEATATGMSTVTFGTSHDAAIDKHANAAAAKMGRGSANIEDQLRSALQVIGGLEVTDPASAAALTKAVNTQLAAFLKSLFATERGISHAAGPQRGRAEAVLQSFLLSFASRSASRERLHIFTTNYDRLLEYAFDLAGLRMIDRFVGALNPVFRAGRVEVDYHYNPPGIRGEPRFMEGVVRLTKLHGSLDWRFDKKSRRIVRRGIPFAAEEGHTDIPSAPIDTVMIYPNPAKDVETTEYPYAELFRDFAAASCRPNSVVVTYGYGFGDDHINRVLLDMLTIPSTHLVIISRDGGDRLQTFCKQVRDSQLTLLVGSHFAHLPTLVEHYLPKPALDYITGRLAELLKLRPEATKGTPSGEGKTGAAPLAEGAEGL